MLSGVQPSESDQFRVWLPTHSLFYALWYGMARTYLVTNRNSVPRWYNQVFSTYCVVKKTGRKSYEGACIPTQNCLHKSGVSKTYQQTNKQIKASMVQWYDSRFGFNPHGHHECARSRVQIPVEPQLFHFSFLLLIQQRKNSFAISKRCTTIQNAFEFFSQFRLLEG